MGRRSAFISFIGQSAVVSRPCSSIKFSFQHDIRNTRKRNARDKVMRRNYRTCRIDNVKARISHFNKALEIEARFKGAPIGNCQWESNGHVTDDVT